MNFLIFEPYVVPVFLFVVSVIFFAVFYFLYYTYKREKEFLEKENSLLGHYNAILQEAHGKAKEIIDKATEGAASLLTQTQKERQHVSEKVEEALQKVTHEQIQLIHENAQEFLQEYQSSLTSVQDTYLKQLTAIFEDLQKTTKQEFDDLHSVLQTQISDQKLSLGRRIEDDYEKAQIEIQDYKKHELERIETSLQLLITKVAEEVLGKAIPLKDHQELIIASLEKAKKEGIFTL